MTASDHFGEACRLIAQSPGLATFYGGKSDAAIRRAQEILGIPFPRSYVSFLRKYGCGHVPLHEIYGLVDDDCSAKGVPNSVWVTLDERRWGLPGTYVLIESSGDGAHYCLETAVMNDEGECPVVLYIPHAPAKPARVAVAFGTYFLTRVHEALLHAGSTSGSNAN
jgi:hypothetical protein